MPTAKEMRDRAWRQFSEPGTFWRYFAAMLVLTGIAMVVFMALFLVSIGLPVLLGLKTAGSEEVNTPGASMVLVTLLGSTVMVFGSLLLTCFATWSRNAMAIAFARNGITVQHAFSGRGHVRSMLNLLFREGTVIFLKLLLLIVPGVKAAFSYAVSGLVLVDHPEWTAKQCMDESARLMEGHRMRLFRLLLSFIPWIILAQVMSWLIPFLGCLGPMAVSIYFDGTRAMFYEDLLDRDSIPRYPQSNDPLQ